MDHINAEKLILKLGKTVCKGLCGEGREKVWSSQSIILMLEVTKNLNIFFFFDKCE